MSVSKNDFAPYSKAEIVEALLRQFNWLKNDNTLSSVLLQAKQNRLQKLIQKSDSAFANYKKASEKAIKYRTGLFTKYGKNTLSLGELTPDEVINLAKLENEKSNLWKEYQKIDKQGDKICK